MLLKKAVGSDWKGKMSPVLYAAAIPLAFWSPALSLGLYVLVAALWLIPDRRVEKVLVEKIWRSLSGRPHPQPDQASNITRPSGFGRRKFAAGPSFVESVNKIADTRINLPFPAFAVEDAVMADRRLQVVLLAVWRQLAAQVVGG